MSQTNLDGILQAMKKGFDAVDGQLGFLATKVINIESRLETFATKDELHRMEDRILISIDGLAKRHNDFDIEIVSMRHGLQRHEERLNLIEKPA